MGGKGITSFVNKFFKHILMGSCYISPPHQALQLKKNKLANKMHKLFKPQGNPGIQIRFEMTLVPLKLFAAVKLRRQGG